MSECKCSKCGSTSIEVDHVSGSNYCDSCGKFQKGNEPISKINLRPAVNWGDALMFINLQDKEIKKLKEALRKCVELCVCQTESEMFIDEAKEALGEK